MSDFKHNPGFGSLFVNASANPKAPVLRGEFADSTGKLWEIAAWKSTDRDGQPKKDKNGKGYFTLRISEPQRSKDAKPEAPILDDEDIFGPPAIAPSACDLLHDAIGDCQNDEDITAVIALIKKSKLNESELASLRIAMREKTDKLKRGA